MVQALGEFLRDLLISVHLWVSNLGCWCRDNVEESTCGYLRRLRRGARVGMQRGDSGLDI